MILEGHRSYFYSYYFRSILPSKEPILKTITLIFPEDTQEASESSLKNAKPKKEHRSFPATTYKLNVFCCDVMVDSVSGTIVHRPFKLRGSVLGSGGVIPDKVGSFHQEVEEEARELQSNGDAEEDHGVLLLIRQKKLGEDAT